MKNTNLVLVSVLIGILTFSGCGFSGEVNPKKELESELNFLDTSSWEVYVNEDYGFKIKYPSELRVDDKVTQEGADGELHLISFTKNKGNFMVITPQTSPGSRGAVEPYSYQQIIDGESAFVEEWKVEDDGAKVVIKLLDPVKSWMTCDESEFCQHISFLGQENTDVDIFRTMISTIEFSEN